MSKHVRWLHEQSGNWVARGAITEAQAEQIRGFYPAPAAVLPWSMIIFTGLGAVVGGLGVILLLAYNWQAIPKLGKLSLIFVSLIAAHAGGLRCWREEGWKRQLGEALSVLGTMLFGAGIWLVAQVYHIDEHYPNGFLFWGVGALALAWTLPSVAVGVVATVVLSVWGCTEVFGFAEPLHWSPLVVAVGCGALAWRLRSRLLLALVLAGFYVVLLSNAAQGAESLIFPAGFNVSVLIIALAVLVRGRSAFSGSAGILEFFGYCGALFCLYLLTFQSVADEVLTWHRAWRAEPGKLDLVLYAWLPLTLALAAWLWVALESLTKGRKAGGGSNVEQWLLPFSALLAQLLAATGLHQLGDVVAGIFNLVFLAIAAMWMARGCREGALRSVILGSVLLVALVAARYFDLFESLAARGLVFVIVGGVLFAEGFFYRRVRRQKDPREGQS